MNTTQANVNWKLWQKILFRFFFVFLLLLSQVAYNPFLELIGYGYRKQVLLINAPLKGVVSWLDDHIFHIGYLPRQHAVDFSDTHFGVVLFLTIFIIALVSCVMWSLIDRRRSGYNRLYYWFSNYLAYYIFLAMITYAVYKIIPIQARYPTAPELLTRWGSLRNWEVLFRFMGTSPAYCMFCGWLELIASSLILFNRTRVLGGILMTIVLVQVVCFNIFYNNNIILLSAILLMATLFIIARTLPKLFLIFIDLKPVSLVQRRYKFTTPWKKYTLIALCFLPLWKVFTVTAKGWIFYKGDVRNQKKQRLYNVAVYQQDNDTIPPLTTDTIRWKYVCFLDYTSTNQEIVIFDMQETQFMHPCHWDSLSQKIIIAGKDSAHFSYTDLPDGNMQLNGSWHGKNTSIQLAKLSIDSLSLVKDKFLFMQEDQ
jgi:hypothetical protein